MADRSRMTARDDLIDEYGRADTAPLGSLADLKQKLDAYRTEVLREAAETADCLTRENSPIAAVTTLAASWYDGLNVAVQLLHRMADEAGKDTREGESTQPAELTIYRAAYEHERIPLGLYTTQEAARAHCEAEARLGQPDDVEITFDWIGDEDDPEETWELVAEFGGQEQPTDYTVHPITVASAYDPEAEG